MQLLRVFFQSNREERVEEKTRIPIASREPVSWEMTRILTDQIVKHQFEIIVISIFRSKIKKKKKKESEK